MNWQKKNSFLKSRFLYHNLLLTYSTALLLNISKAKKYERTLFKSTIDKDLQKHLNRILKNHHLRLKDNLINNLAAIVVEVESGNVIAYAGNVKSGKTHNESVDVVKAPRSTGSILKTVFVRHDVK